MPFSLFPRVMTAKLTDISADQLRRWGVKLLMLDPLDYTVYEEYCSLSALEPLQPFVTELYFSGDFTTYGLSLIDEFGMERIFAIGQSGRNGELVVWEVTGNN